MDPWVCLPGSGYCRVSPWRVIRRKAKGRRARGAAYGRARGESGVSTPRSGRPTCATPAPSELSCGWSWRARPVLPWALRGRMARDSRSHTRPSAGVWGTSGGRRGPAKRAKIRRSAVAWLGEKRPGKGFGGGSAFAPREPSWPGRAADFSGGAYCIMLSTHPGKTHNRTTHAANQPAPRKTNDRASTARRRPSRRDRAGEAQASTRGRTGNKNRDLFATKTQWRRARAPGLPTTARRSRPPSPSGRWTRCPASRGPFGATSRSCTTPRRWC